MAHQTGQLQRFLTQFNGIGLQIEHTENRTHIPTLLTTFLYLSYFKWLGCWLLSLTPVSYLSKLLGLRSVAAYKQLELFWA
ncbi:MAG TPA: hypothetical protein DIW66_02210 [Serratia liquefaciens]|nr:hypothetical protein [Serratia liquefaciens]